MDTLEQANAALQNRQQQQARRQAASSLKPLTPTLSIPQAEPEAERLYRCPDCEEYKPAAQHDTYRCKACTAKRRKAENRRERESRQESYRRQLETIPARYRNARLNQLPGKLSAILRTVMDVLIFGDVGVGKTHAALAGLRYRLGKRIHYVNWESFCINLRDFNNGSEADKLARLTEPDVLVLDDIGTSATDFSSRALFCVIDTRLNDCKSTFITSNASPDALEAMYGKRIGSRLAMCKSVELKGKDRRKA